MDSNTDFLIRNVLIRNVDTHFGLCYDSHGFAVALTGYELLKVAMTFIGCSRCEKSWSWL